MCGSIGPAWTRGEIEAPAGTQNMGSWTASVYTPEQQERLGVDAQGNATTTAPASTASASSSGNLTVIGPSWTQKSGMEPPKGEKDMGGWKAAIYTEEQQKRLQVDEQGNKLQKAESSSSTSTSAEASTAAATSAATAASAPASTENNESLEDLLTLLSTQINGSNWVDEQPRIGPSIFDNPSALAEMMSSGGGGSSEQQAESSAIDMAARVLTSTNFQSSSTD